MTFDPSFEEQDFVNQVIQNWRNNSDTFILKTSGSTGKPSQVALPRALLVWSCERFNDKFEINNPSVWCCLPVTKTAGFMSLIRALYFEGSIYFSKPSLSPRVPSDRNFDFTSLSPFQLRYLLQKSSQSLLKISNVLVGGAAVSEDIIESLKNTRSTVFLETYGMTETASNIAMRNISAGEEWFTPHEGVFLSATNEGTKIAIPELDFKIKCNDIITKKGNKFRVIGRVDEVINSDGLKLNLTDLSSEFKKYVENMPTDFDFYLTKKPDEVMGEKLVLVTLNKFKEAFPIFLRQLESEMSSKMLPKEVIFVKKFDYTDTGKIKKGLN